MKAKFDNVLLGFIIKSVFLSVVIVAFLTAIMSKVVLVFDLDNSYCAYSGFFVLFVTSVAVGFLSTVKFKNSLILMSILSNVPILILSVINSIINKSFGQLCISVAIIAFGSVLASVFNAKRTRKLKVWKWKI